MDFSDQAGRWNAVAVDSNGHIHVVQIKDESYQIRHSVNDGTGWNTVGINDCGSTYCCLLYTSPSPRDLSTSRMPSSA